MPLCLEGGAELRALFDPEQELELIAGPEDGLIFTEGPIWNRAEGHLTFSDIPANVMYRWDPVQGLRRLVEYSHKANGNAYAPDGSIVTCEHATSRLARRDGDGGGYKVLCSHYRGKELNSPNDVIVRRDGSIYFTDPHFGRTPSQVGLPRAEELGFRGIYRLSSGELTLLDDVCEDPNGLCFSADEQVLYVDDSPRCEVLAYDVLPDGTLSGRRLWAVTEGDGAGKPDGLKLDRDGNLYCCAQGGLHIFSSGGRCLGRIRVPVQLANLCFGDADGKTLYLCASDRIYRLRGSVPGLC